MSTQVGCRINAHAKLNVGKMSDIDIGNQVLGVGFCRQRFVLKTLALARHFYMKRRRLARKKRLARIQANKVVGLVIGLHPSILSILSKCLNVSRFFPGRLLLSFIFLYFCFSCLIFSATRV